MKIDFFRVLENNFKNNNVVKDFINELSNYLEKDNNIEEDFLEKIKKDNKLSLISENRILKEKNGIIKKYPNKPEKIKSEIIKMANRVLKNQNEKLSKARKEGHLYMVEEDVNERIYLLDLTERTDCVFEEVDFPSDLINKATEGAVFKYKNGEYHFYSYDGFERLYE